MQNKYSPYFGTIIYLKIPNFIPIPSNWKHDKLNVCPVYKKGDKYEHMLSLAASCNILRNILYDFQHGFRLSNSCETQLISFIHDLAQSAINNIQTDIIIMDFAKGVKQTSTLQTYYGVNNNILHGVTDFLDQRSHTVVLEGETSDLKRPSKWGQPLDPSPF